MRHNLIVSAIIMMLVSACTPYHEVYRQQLESLPYKYVQFDAKLSWDARISGSELNITGVVQNIRYSQVNNMEVWVTLKDPSGATIARSVSYIVPDTIYQDETAPFSMTLPHHNVTNGKLIFTYQYVAHEGPEDGMKWHQSFEAAMPER